MSSTQPRSNEPRGVQSMPSPAVAPFEEILDELYAVKAAINREANYDIATLLANAKLAAERRSN
jgi:hypothetical protein